MRVVVFFVFCFFLLSCQTAPKNEDIDHRSRYHVQLARGHLTKCLYPQALLEMKKALKLEPGSYILNDAIGVVYFLMKKYPLAADYFLKALKLEPHYTEARVNLSQTLIHQKKFKEALVHLEKAKEDLTYTNPSKLHSILGQVYLHDQKPAMAKTHFEDSLKMNSNNCSSLFYLGKLYFDQKKDQQAIRKFKQTSVCQEKTRLFSCETLKTDHYYFQARSEIRLSQFKKARKSLRLFIKKSSEFSPYFNDAQKLLNNMD